MSIEHPAQKLCYLERHPDQGSFLLAAVGPNIFSYSLQHSELVSIWPSEPKKGGTEDEVGNGKHPNDNDDGESRSKRCRTKYANSDQDSPDSPESVEIIAQRPQGHRRKKKSTHTELANVSYILPTLDRQHVVSVTTDDKCIRLFHVNSKGRLSLVNERSMPKRLCAVALTADGSTILCGDKFGDVYSLPVHLSSPTKTTSSALGKQNPTPDFRPSASELTVHTKGNRAALRQQQERKAAALKEGPKSEHNLHLGHVSLLTDLITASAWVEKTQRHYILTADRDEHIRVSRGIPQAHIIENYCLCHKDFVSKLRIPPWQPSMLLAGSGEPSLKSFDWQNGNLMQDNVISGTALEDVSTTIAKSKGERTVKRLAVSGIWTIETTIEKDLAPHMLRTVLVALEGLPIILSYRTDLRHGLKHHQTIRLSGNVLDVAIPETQCKIMVSLDAFHEPCSVKTRRPSTNEDRDHFQSFDLVSSGLGAHGKDDDLYWRSSNDAVGINKAFQKLSVDKLLVHKSTTSNANSTYSDVGEFLYGLENLRKRTGIDAVDEKEEDMI